MIHSISMIMPSQKKLVLSEFVVIDMDDLKWMTLYLDIIEVWTWPDTSSSCLTCCMMGSQRLYPNAAKYRRNLSQSCLDQFPMNLYELIHHCFLEKCSPGIDIFRPGLEECTPVRLTSSVKIEDDSLVSDANLSIIALPENSFLTETSPFLFVHGAGT